MLGEGMLALIQSAGEDLNAYESTKHLCYLDEGNMLAKRWSQYGRLQAERLSMSEPSEDWQLHNLEKALWWAVRDLKQAKKDLAKNDQGNVQHVFCLWNQENVAYLKNRLHRMNGDPSGNTAYADIEKWLESEDLEMNGDLE